MDKAVAENNTLLILVLTNVQKEQISISILGINLFTRRFINGEAQRNCFSFLNLKNIEVVASIFSFKKLYIYIYCNKTVPSVKISHICIQKGIGKKVADG